MEAASIGYAVGGIGRSLANDIGAGNKARQGQIPEWLDRLASASEQMDKSIAVLAERLSPASRGLVPGENEKAAPEEMLVPVANSLRNLYRRIAAQTRALETLSNQIEL